MTATARQPQLYVGGAWVDASGDDAVAVLNPATEEVIAEVPQGTAADVDAAIGRGARPRSTKARGPASRRASARTCWSGSSRRSRPGATTSST